MHTGCMEIEFDPRKAALNRRKHGGHYNGSMDELRWVTIGMDALGRILVVVYTERRDALRIISARKASVGEARQYHA